ncbi:MAG TPA: hypothetical protein VFM93_06640 [Candidatus Limnocylindria bacterium]|nr:hypothetical protein [Candidatus Limnocylindria bacterium]
MGDGDGDGVRLAVSAGVGACVRVADGAGEAAGGGVTDPDVQAARIVARRSSDRSGDRDMGMLIVERSDRAVVTAYADRTV